MPMTATAATATTMQRRDEGIANEEDERIWTQRGPRRSPREHREPPPRRRGDDHDADSSMMTMIMATTPRGGAVLNGTSGSVAGSNGGRERKAPLAVSFSAPEGEDPVESRSDPLLVTATRTTTTTTTMATSAMAADKLQSTPPPVATSGRRNRLEARLEELQRDVANLTLRLRASGGGSGSTSTQARTHAGVPQPTTKAKPSPRARSSQRRVATTGPTRRRSLSQASLRVDDDDNDDYFGGADGVDDSVASDRKSIRSTSAHGRASATAAGKSPELSAQQPPPRSRSRSRSASRQGITGLGGGGVRQLSRGDATRALRELQVVAVERDQLRVELEQAHRDIVTAEKRLREAAKWKEAYEKMKAHCISLQESLDLSEKIRVRQKRLLQQLQGQQQQPQSQSHYGTTTRGAASRAARSQSEPQPPPQVRATRQPTPPRRVDILDSVLDTHSPDTHAAMGEAAPDSRLEKRRRQHARTQRGAGNVSMDRSYRSLARSEFDSMLQQTPDKVPVRRTDRSIANSSISQRTTTIAGGPRRILKPTTAHTAVTTTTASGRPLRSTRARTSGATPSIAGSTRMTTAAPTSTRTGHFLAPTKASLNHVAHHRRTEPPRRPFVP